MTAGTEQGIPVRLRRAAAAAQGLGVGVVLLAFWGTAAVLSRWCPGERPRGGESVRRKA
ncbi:hypothetical protein EES39_33935 [Streptomyces sp. ADI92-24]|nr:hypothetical protein EES39_33935 [Streptomyces sp. ADI92-24]